MIHKSPNFIKGDIKKGALKASEKDTLHRSKRIKHYLLALKGKYENN